MVIVGGAEAWVMASELAATNVGVILQPVLCTPDQYDNRRCRSLSSLEHPMFHRHRVQDMNDLMTSVSILREAGVKLAVASDDDNFIHDVVWMAGWARWMSNRRIDGSLAASVPEMSHHEAVGLLTWQLADILGLNPEQGSIKKGRASLLNAVLYAGRHPMDTTAAPLALSFIPQTPERLVMRCNPRQV